MKTLYFVPGLQGHLNVGQDIPHPLSNRAAATRAAGRLGLAFQTVAYQTSANKFPTISSMPKNLTKAVMANHDPSLAVTTSVGFGVFVQSLSSLFSAGCRPPHVISIMGVPDPLAAVELQAKHTKTTDLLQAVQQGQAPAFNLPLLKSDNGPEPGHFRLTPKHFKDRRVLRVTTNPIDQQILTRLSTLSGTKVPSMLLITSQQDPFYAMTKKFADLAQPWVDTPIKIIETDGPHGKNRCEELEPLFVSHAQQIGL